MRKKTCKPVNFVHSVRILSEKVNLKFQITFGVAMFVYTIIPKHVATTSLLGIYILLHKKISKKIYTVDDTIH